MKRKMTRRRAVVSFVLLCIIAAWIVGMKREQPLTESTLSQAIPDAVSYGQIAPDIFVAYRDAGHQTVIGYVAIEQSSGYGGPMTVAVGVNTSGHVIRFVVIDHQESGAYYHRVIDAGLPDHLLGKNYLESFSIGDDVDAVTGATKTAGAMTGAVRQATRNVASTQLGKTIPPERPVPIRFGLLEASGLVLFALALVSQTKKFPCKKQVRWVSLITGFIVLGFLFNVQLTLTNVNSLLIGYWPDWRTDPFWYILIIGVLLIPLLTGKTPYCKSICPFGAAQECLAMIGTAKSNKQKVASCKDATSGDTHSSKRSRRFWAYSRWVPRCLTLALVVTALAHRSPSLANYEVYAALFSFVGTSAQFGLLAVVLIGSLLIVRPWCRLLCPIRPVTDLLRSARRCVMPLPGNSADDRSDSEISQDATPSAEMP